MSRITRASIPGPVERLVRRDQHIVTVAVALVVMLAGLYTYVGVGMEMTAAQMNRMALPNGASMPMGVSPVWTPGYAGLILVMWWIMMIAMMTPSAAPLLLLYTAIKRMGPEGSRAVWFSLLLLCGYLSIWLGFSMVAAGLQWAAQSAGLLNGPAMTLKSREATSVVLILAGAYQLSRLKDACLTHCRSPAQFLADHSAPGAWGAVRTGAHHGAYCLGCCWALMALLFVGGIMNLYWIVGLALYVMAEKFAMNARAFSRIVGIALIVAGVATLTQVFA